MTAHVIRADSRTLPLADNTVDLIVTSPPYFGLRSYQDGGKHYAGQVGDEATPAEFVDALLDVTRECVRVLKPTGSLWVNLGDKYMSRQFGYGDTDGGSWAKVHAHEGDQRQNGQRRADRVGGQGVSKSGAMSEATGIPRKSLMGLPWRYALRCIDDLGLILRAEVIWSKPNGLPESVTDRVRRSHEQWFHFVREPRYYSAVDEVREAYGDAHARPGDTGQAKKALLTTEPGRIRSVGTNAGLEVRQHNPLGKLPGSVWTIPTQPLQVPAHLGVDHFAAFPMEWPRRIIKGWSPSGICVECGEGRRPVAEQVDESYKAARSAVRATTPRDLAAHSKTGRSTGASASDISNGVVRPDYRITGESCACSVPDAPTRPAVVIDPFGGTGTTALVASVLGRTGLSFDLSHDYSRLARWRTTDPGQRAAAMQVEKPPAQVDGQDSLFEEFA